jgi:2-methylisocitrate lyase-like PEP mutase family enzyme
VTRDAAVARIRAAVDARDEGADIVVLARTDARATHGLDEALWRIEAYQDLGAEIVFMEAPESQQEMAAFCEAAKVPALANMVEGGKTPLLPPAALASLGYKIAAYPLTLLESAVFAMKRVLGQLARGEPANALVSFEELKTLVGFDEYYAQEGRYRDG